MFNNSLKKDAIAIHKIEVDKYNSAYDKMMKNCEALYDIRLKAIECITDIEELINSIANTPKEFEKKMSIIKSEKDNFKDTQEYINKSITEEIKSGAGIVTGVAAGGIFAGMAPNVVMGIATTFGTASTGTAISALSGAAAKRAALAWIGRAVTAGAGGMAAGQAALALAGPIGWGITAVTTGVSLISLSSQNKKIAKEAEEEAIRIATLRGNIQEIDAKISNVFGETDLLVTNICVQNSRLMHCLNANYTQLDHDTQMELGSLVNNTLALSELLNKTVE